MSKKVNERENLITQWGLGSNLKLPAARMYTTNYEREIKMSKRMPVCLPREKSGGKVADIYYPQFSFQNISQKILAQFFEFGIVWGYFETIPGKYTLKNTRPYTPCLAHDLKLQDKTKSS